MKKSILIFLCIVLSYAQEETNADLVEPEPSLPQLTKIFNTVRNRTTTWKAMDPKKNPFRKYNETQLKRALGIPGLNYKKMREEMIARTHTIIIPDTVSSVEYTIPESVGRIFRSGITLPDSYNWLEESPYKDCMPPVWNQGTCGSCYAFASAAVFSIRYCMAKAKKNNGVIEMIEHSPQDITSCNIHTNQCNGGAGDYSFTFMEEYGITTYQCQPYVEGSNSQPTASPCNPTSCTGTESVDFTKHFCKRGSTVALLGTEQIKYELYKYGPVLTTMTVYKDFSGYKEGIYKYTTGELSGGHAIVLLGWGKEDGKDYWYARNSWGADWGIGGYFKIDMTDTASEFGEDAFYCIPDV